MLRAAASRITTTSEILLSGRPLCEVVAQQLHDEHRVLVALLVEGVELRDGVVEGLLRELARLRALVLHLVQEGRVAARHSQPQRVRCGQRHYGLVRPSVCVVCRSRQRQPRVVHRYGLLAVSQKTCLHLQVRDQFEHCPGVLLPLRSLHSVALEHSTWDQAGAQQVGHLEAGRMQLRFDASLVRHCKARELCVFLMP